MQAAEDLKNKEKEANNLKIQEAKAEEKAKEEKDITKKAADGKFVSFASFLHWF